LSLIIGFEIYSQIHQYEEDIPQKRWHIILR